MWWCLQIRWCTGLPSGCTSGLPNINSNNRVRITFMTSKACGINQQIRLISSTLVNCLLTQTLGKLGCFISYSSYYLLELATIWMLTAFCCTGTITAYNYNKLNLIKSNNLPWSICWYANGKVTVAAPSWTWTSSWCAIFSIDGLLIVCLDDDYLDLRELPQRAISTKSHCKTIYYKSQMCAQRFPIQDVLTFCLCGKLNRLNFDLCLTALASGPIVFQYTKDRQWFLTIPTF